MNDSQRLEIGRFPQTICLVIVAIHRTLCLPPCLPPTEMLQEINDMQQGNLPNQYEVNSKYGALDGQVTQPRSGGGQTLFPNIPANLTANPMWPRPCPGSESLS